MSALGNLTKLEREAKENYELAVQKMDEQDSRIQALSDDIDEDERKFQNALFDKLQEDAERARGTWERQIALRKARESVPVIRSEEDDDGDDGDGDARTPRTRIQRERQRISGIKEPLVYEPGSGNSYFRDLLQMEVNKDAEAQLRLELHGRQIVAESRDVTTADPGAAAFIPPLYLGGEWIDTATAGRPFANAIVAAGGGIPLSPVGKRMDFPRVQVAPTTGVQAAEADPVNELDFDSETYSVNKVTIAGQNDVSIQTLEFSDPSIDTIIMRELTKDYNSRLDGQLIYGSGSSGQHRGIKTVVVSDSGNTVAFSSGGADDLLGKIYEAVAAVATNAPGFDANTVLLHSRRAAWMASHRDGNGNLFQQGQLFLAAGAQDMAMVASIAGLSPVKDANILTNQGTGTNEDDVYVMDIGELMLAEGPVRTRVLQEVLSGTLQVRIQLYAFSAFAGGRRPKAITRISGAGLATPTFPST